MNSPRADAAGGVRVTHDTILGGRLRLEQPEKGHRAGTDAVLLAAATPVSTGLLIDAGAGVGTAGLAVALRDPASRVVLLEREPALAKLAGRNCTTNGLADRVTVARTDLLSAPECRAAGVETGRADLVLTNPPFYAPESGRPSPHPLKRGAHTLAEPLAAWLTACTALLRPGGTLVLIHRPEALPDLLATLAGRCGALTLRPVHPKAGAAANRVILTGTKGSRAPVRILPALVLHGPEGRFMEEAAALHDGRTPLLQ